MKYTNQLPVEQKSASGSLVIPAINYHRRKRAEPRRASTKSRLESRKIEELAPEIESKIVDLYQSKNTMRAIALQTNISRARVAWVLHKHGIYSSGWNGRKTSTNFSERGAEVVDLPSQDVI